MADLPRPGSWPQTSGPGLLAFSDPRRLINGSIVAMALVVFVLSGTAAWTAYTDYREAHRLSSAVTASEHLIRATGQHALERGLTALRLGLGNDSSPPGAPGTSTSRAPFPDHGQIREVRRHGDAAWRRGLEEVRELVRQLDGPPDLEQALARTERAHDRLQQDRQRLDAFLEGSAPKPGGGHWFGTSTAFIEHTAQLHRTVSDAVTMPPAMSRLHRALQEHAWLASEHAGRIRGLMAYYLGARMAVPEPMRVRLQGLRGVVKRNLEALIRRRPDTEPPIDGAIATMTRVYRSDYRPVEREVLAAASSGDYPLEARQWITRATAAINSIRGVSAAIARTVEGRAAELRRERAWMLGGYLGLMLLTGGLAGFSLLGVRRAANAMFRQKELAEVTVHSIGDAVITTDGQGRVEYLNPVAEEMVGWTTEQARGRPVDDIFTVLNVHTREPEPSPVEICLRQGRVAGLESSTLLVRPDGMELLIEDSAAPIRDRGGSIVGAVLVFYDIGSDSQPEHLLGYHSAHDTLTRLFNRREFERRLANLVHHARAEDSEHALVVVDLDRFKLVNDTCGHGAGDQLLRLIGRTLSERLRPGDTLARLGGDEFGLLLRDVSLEQANRMAEEMLGLLRELRFTWEGKTFGLDASLGLVPITADSPEATTLLTQADAACFTAKDTGFDPVQVYRPENVETARRHTEMQWVPRITAAMEEDRLRLDCQPIVPVQGDGPSQGEILVRMLDEDGETVPPMSFIPVAERYGLMPEIDRWVVRRGLATMGANLARIEERRPLCNINLSGTSVADPELAGFIERELETSGVPPEMVCFEITETAAVGNFEQARAFITTMRAMGCHFALDDFGSGLSSFTYLNNLPVDFLKIDGHLISRIADDPVTYSMVQAIQQVGRAMGIQTIGEFVDDEQTLECLRQIGVDYAQGFGIARPRPIEECLTSCCSPAV